VKEFDIPEELVVAVKHWISVTYSSTTCPPSKAGWLNALAHSCRPAQHWISAQVEMAPAAIALFSHLVGLHVISLHPSSSERQPTQSSTKVQKHEKTTESDVQVAGNAVSDALSEAIFGLVKDNLEAEVKLVRDRVKQQHGELVAACGSWSALLEFARNRLGFVLAQRDSVLLLVAPPDSAAAQAVMECQDHLVCLTQPLDRYSSVQWRTLKRFVVVYAAMRADHSGAVHGVEYPALERLVDELRADDSGRYDEISKLCWGNVYEILQLAIVKKHWLVPRRQGGFMYNLPPALLIPIFNGGVDCAAFGADDDSDSSDGDGNGVLPYFFTVFFGFFLVESIFF